MPLLSSSMNRMVRRSSPTSLGAVLWLSVPIYIVASSIAKNAATRADQHTYLFVESEQIAKDIQAIRQLELHSSKTRQRILRAKNSTKLMSKITFVKNCSTWLLSYPAGNGVISQNEYSAYLYSLCPSCYNSTMFSDLPMDLQLDFVYVVCDTDPDLERCVEGLMAQHLQDQVFGIRINNNANSSVQSLCADAYSDLEFDFGQTSNPMPSSGPSPLPASSNVTSTAPSSITWSSAFTSTDTPQPAKSPAHAPTQISTSAPSLKLQYQNTTNSTEGQSMVIASRTGDSNATIASNATTAVNGNPETAGPTSFPSSAPSPASSASSTVLLTASPTTSFAPSATVAVNNSTMKLHATVQFSFLVELSRSMTAKEIIKGERADGSAKNSIASDLAEGISSVLAKAAETRSAANLSYDSISVTNKNIEDQICPNQSNHGSCILFVSRAHFKIDRGSDQLGVADFILQTLESSMSPMGTALLDQIHDRDIVDVYFLGDGMSGTQTNAAIRGSGAEANIASSVPSQYLYAVLAASIGVVLVTASTLLLVQRIVLRTRRLRRQGVDDGLVQDEDPVSEPRSDEIAVTSVDSDLYQAGETMARGNAVKVPRNFRSITTDAHPDDVTQIISNRSPEERYSGTTKSEHVTACPSGVLEETGERGPGFRLFDYNLHSIFSQRNEGEYAGEMQVSLGWDSFLRFFKVRNRRPPKSAHQQCPTSKAAASPRVECARSISANGMHTEEGSFAAATSPALKLLHSNALEIPALHKVSYLDAIPDCTQVGIDTRLKPTCSDDDSDVSGDDFGHSETISRSSASLSSISEEHINYLEKLIENDDWERLVVTGSRYEQHEPCLSRSSATKSDFAKLGSMSSSMSLCEHENIEMIDKFLEEGNWEALAEVAAALSEQNAGSNGNGHVQSTSSQSSESIYSTDTSGTQVSTNTSNREGAEIAAEWAISRSLSNLVGREMDSTEGASMKEDSKSEV